MTQIGKMFLDEMEEQVAKARKEVTEQVTQQVTQQVTAQMTAQMAQQAKQAEQTNAKMLSLLIESLAKNEGVEIEEACQKLNISVADYENAVLLARSGNAA